MSYKALLFCPDEKTARLVTQVLQELDFTIEPGGDPFSTVKRLTDEQFHALVVDCENEQNASLLFKGARNSTLNHSSLYVAVVEGQTGVAKAFRIGANLVLTKPINIEQSKSTLRVARGLLRKSEAKAPAPAARLEPISQAPKTQAQAPKTQAQAPKTQPPKVKAALASAAAAPGAISAPAARPAPGPVSSASRFPVIEVEAEPQKTPDVAEAALLESIPAPAPLKSAPSEPSLVSAKAAAGPISITGGGSAGAAVQPAFEKPAAQAKSAPEAKTENKAGETRTAGRDFAAPTLSLYIEDERAGARPTKALRIVALILVAAGLGYAAWRNRETLSAMSPWHSTAELHAPVRQAPPSPVLSAAAEPEPTPVQPTPALPSAASPAAGDPTPSSADSAPPPQHRTAASESIEVSEFPEPQPKLTVTPKPQPLAVKTGRRLSAKADEPAPPALPVSSAAANTDLSGIVSLSPAPAPILGTVRISQGVSQGLLVTKVAPVYPPSALQLRKEGSVELLATVSKTGAIDKVKVLSGDASLAAAAVKAVRQWKYRPYLLNSEPVEIETQITIRFRLPN